MKKTAVYSRRLSPHLRSELEEAARAKERSMAELLEEIAQEWLQRFKVSNGDDEERQRVLHEAAMKCAGTIRGDDPNRAANARFLVRNAAHEDMSRRSEPHAEAREAPVGKR